jgi:hypothetical protein
MGSTGWLLLRRAAHLSGDHLPLRVRSVVGLTPLFAVQTLTHVIEAFPVSQVVLSTIVV